MNRAPKQAPPKKSPIAPVLMAGALVIIAAVCFKIFQSSPPTPSAPAPAEEVARPVAAPNPAPRHAQPRDEAIAAAQATPSPAPLPPAVPTPPPEFIRADPKDLVSVITSLTGKEPITPEQAEKWKQSLQQLVRQGPSSVPAIQQFLSQNLDANFAGVSGAGALGYGSVRSAMLDALAQIGGPDSTAAMLQVLQTSIFPTDIATLAKDLDAQGAGQGPGQYQQAILDAVRQQLNLGAMDQLGSANVLPLFQVLANEAGNGANITTDLTQYAEKWPYYSAIALAALPDNAGVPSLVQIAQGTVAGNQAAAAQALAELAPNNAQALSTLLDLAKGGQLSDNVLSQLAPYLGGQQYELGPPKDPTAGGYLTFHMANGNQDFSAYDASGTLTQPQLAQRISIIDQLLQNVPSTDTTAVDTLQAQRAALAGRQKP